MLLSVVSGLLFVVCCLLLVVCCLLCLACCLPFAALCLFCDFLLTVVCRLLLLVVVRYLFCSLLYVDVGRSLMRSPWFFGVCCLLFPVSRTNGRLKLPGTKVV